MGPTARFFYHVGFAGRVKEKFLKIWDLALPYQDKREDPGHARVVTAFAEELLASEGGDEGVVIPAAILHDVGWSRIPKKERMSVFDGMPDPVREREVRIRHQEEGVRIARDILTKAHYDPSLSEEILELVGQHDTRDGIYHHTVGLMRDAERLWVFSEEGFAADVRRRRITRERWAKYLESIIGRLHTGSAKRIAKRELSLRTMKG